MNSLSILSSRLGCRLLMRRSLVSATTPCLEKKTMTVPTMGDSITEGTIVEWSVQLGQMVKEGDVVALVETDKVTIDIKADMDGVITQQFGAVDEEVEVGADLYEIDTEAEATVDGSSVSSAPILEASSTPSTETAAVTQAAAAAAPATTPSGASHDRQPQQRVPSISFLGKEGWNRMLSGEDMNAPIVYDLPANYGRPTFSEAEIDALIMGGADLAPEVKQHSSGAQFGY